MYRFLQQLKLYQIVTYTVIVLCNLLKVHIKTETLKYTVEPPVFELNGSQRLQKI